MATYYPTLFQGSTEELRFPRKKLVNQTLQDKGCRLARALAFVTEMIEWFQAVNPESACMFFKTVIDVLRQNALATPSFPHNMKDAGSTRFSEGQEVRVGPDPFTSARDRIFNLKSVLLIIGA